MFSKFIRFLGSVRLAVPLLGAIAIILVVATVLESQIGSATVQHDIYKSPWFGALMFLLAMNLGVSTLSRYPWRGARKVGFALTHIGLIVIIAGSAAVIHLSTEGMLLIRTDGLPRDEIRVEGDLLDLVTPDQQHQQSDIFVKADGTVFPQHVGDLSLLGYSENSITQVSFEEGSVVDNMAIKLEMKSDRMGQTLERWLASAPSGYQSVDLGPATLELIQAGSPQDLDTYLAEPNQNLGPLGLLEIHQGGQSIQLDVENAIHQPQKLRNGFQLEIANFWPDFRLDAEGNPASASQKLSNPALQVLISKGDIQEQWYLFSHTEFPTIRSGNDLKLPEEAMTFQAPLSTSSDFFRVLVSDDKQLYYAANSSKGFLSGPLKLGETIIPGWADFQLTLETVLDHAQIQRAVVPVMPVATQAQSSSSPALHVATPDGQDFWLPWGEALTLDSSNGNYLAAFSPKVLKLPFEVQLNDFIVERNEGSESVAMWTSDIQLRDSAGQASERRVWMNHPTWFRGWKLAQASWNPGDLSQSTLQLKREPWWVTGLTWLGSLLIVSGITTMFYGRALAKQLKRTAASIPNSPEDAPSDRADQPDIATA